MIDLLRIINARDFRTDSDTDIKIINNNKCPFIEYKKKNKNGTKEINTVNKLDINLAKASDLDYLLRTRCWLSPERKFIDGRKNLCIINDNGDLDFIPTIYTNENEGEYILTENGIPQMGVVLNSIAPGTLEVLDDIIYQEPLALAEEGEENKENITQPTGYITPINKIRKIVSNFRLIENNKKKELNITEDTLYNIIQRNLNKISGGSVDIICQGSGTYTNIINLNHYIDITGTSINKQKVIVKLGISYAKKNTGGVDKYFKEISFTPFSFVYESRNILKAVPENFIREVNEEVVIEFINGCIRVFATNKNITECIISFCNLNYE